MFNAIIHFKIIYYNKFCFDIAIFSLNLKNFFKIFPVVVNANSNIFIIFIFILIKEILEENENVLINFIHEIINM